MQYGKIEFAGKYPFQLVYGNVAIFPTQLYFPVMEILYDSYEEIGNFSKRINHITELNQDKEEV